MARADAQHATNLSSLIHAPFVALPSWLQSGWYPLAVLTDTPPSLDGGEAVAFRTRDKLRSQRSRKDDCVRLLRQILIYARAQRCP
jgi:hypothetical protein